MFCKDCEFHQSGYMWNRCTLMEAECYREYNFASAKRFLEEIESEVDTNEVMAEMWY